MKKTPKDYIKTVEGYKQFRDKVDEILLEFDFEKVHTVMKSLNWEWAYWVGRDCEEHLQGVPDEYALRRAAQKMLVDAVEKGFGSTGGFEVLCYVYDENPDNEPDDFEHQVCLALKFVVESVGEV